MKNTERFYYIGDHIRRLRESKGWTQQELGKRLGKKTSTISAYETNAKLPSAECLIEMAELFGISLDTLIYGENAELLSVRYRTYSSLKSVVLLLLLLLNTQDAPA